MCIRSLPFTETAVRAQQVFEAAPPKKQLSYDKLCHMLREKDLQVETGRFEQE